MSQSTFKQNSECSEELLATLYSALRNNGHKMTGKYRKASLTEDKYQKIDAYYTIDGKDTPVQLRAYGHDSANGFMGFPIRNAPLVNKNEKELLAEGKLDDVLFAFATFIYQPSQYGKFKFLKIKTTYGSELRKNLSHVVGTRDFGDGNSVEFLQEPLKTEWLRNWN